MTEADYMQSAAAREMEKKNLKKLLFIGFKLMVSTNHTRWTEPYCLSNSYKAITDSIYNWEGLM